MKKVSTFGERVLKFYQTLEVPNTIPSEIQVLNPYIDEARIELVKAFLTKFYADNSSRVLVFGINPGRNGGGTTGVNFTDAFALDKYCGIANDLPLKRELSSEFIYECIHAYGSPTEFFSKFFLSALSPLGFVKNGRNYNYYDDPTLCQLITPFIVDSINKQIKLGGRSDVAILFGTGKNNTYFSHLNEKHKFFEKIYVLEHPRFIMQYKRKFKEEYIKKYLEILSKI